MAKLEEGQTAEYWYERAERYRRQVGGMSSASSKLKHKIGVKNNFIEKLKGMLKDGYLLVSAGTFETSEDRKKAKAWCEKVERLLGEQKNRS